MATKPRARRPAKTRKSSRTLRAPTNLSVRRDLVQRAKALRLNLSKVLESALEAAIKKREQEQWLEDNKDAIDASNAYLEKHGLWSDGLRLF